MPLIGGGFELRQAEESRREVSAADEAAESRRGGRRQHAASASWPAADPPSGRLWATGCHLLRRFLELAYRTPSSSIYTA